MDVDAPLTQLLASFVADTSDIPKAAIEPAKNVILDTIGVALAAADRPIGRIMGGHVQDAGPGPATMFGTGIRTSPEMAALANGTLANALDFDEGSHLATHLLPAVLAVAEQHRLTGAVVLDAFMLGFEAGARLTQV